MTSPDVAGKTGVRLIMVKVTLAAFAKSFRNGIFPSFFSDLLMVCFLPF